MKKLLLIIAIVMAAAYGGLGTVPQAAAQDISAPQAGALAQKLEDPEQRAELIEALRALEAAQATQDTPESAEAEGGSAQLFIDEMLNQMTQGLVAFSVQLASIAQTMFDEDGLRAWFAGQANSEQARAFWLTMLVQVGGLLLAGLTVRYGLRRLLDAPRRNIEARSYPGIVSRLVWLMVRTGLDIIPIVGFAAAAYGTLIVLEFGSGAPAASADAAQNLRLIAIAVIQSVVITRSVLAITRLLVTPLAPNLRMVPLADRTAAYAYVWVSRFVNLGVFGFMLVDILPALGIGANAATGLAKIIGLVLTLMGIVLVLQAREGVAGWLAGRRPNDDAMAVAKVRSVLRARLADVWHVLVIVYLLIGFGVWALEVGDGFALMARGTLGTLAAIIVAEFVIKAAGEALERLFAIDPDLERRFPGLEQRANRYLPAARGVVMVLVLLMAFIAALEAWQVDMLAALASPGGVLFVSRLGRILLVGLASVVVWEISSALIARALSGTDEAGATIVRSQRSRTLLPLAQNALTIVIALVAALTILSELGLDIAPLLAGAGVVGLAIGFGAQTLVKDLITGLFILVEDAIAIGDVVELAGHTGTVEAVTIRTVRLRDITGTVHTVPFSSIDSVKNLTKDFSYYLLDVGVAYRENTDTVVNLLRQVDEDLRADAEFGSDILAPLEVMGVNSFDDSAVIVRARIKTRPLSQWRVGREFNRRMKFCFDANNIEIPFPHQTVYFGVNRDGNAPPARVAMADDANKEFAVDEPLTTQGSSASAPNPTARRAMGEGQDTE